MQNLTSAESPLHAALPAASCCVGYERRAASLESKAELSQAAV